MDDKQMLDVISRRPIGPGALPPATRPRVEAGPASAHGGLPPYARLCAAVDEDGCVWQAAPAPAGSTGGTRRQADRENEAVAAGVNTRDSRAGVRQLRLADLPPARQVQDLRDELESAAADAAALVGEEGETR